VARVELAPEVGDDFGRIPDHLLTHEVEDAASRTNDIIAAIAVLVRNPLIGSPARKERRKLIIGRGTRGHVAVYRYVPAIDTVFVLAVRSQREAGYAR
jgi:plasmid stabilization system protein ParE